MYHYLVIGKGLFGSAAARYLSQVSNSVGVVGPDEPADWSRHQGVFGSHYNEARVASFTGPDAVWTRLDQASMAQYRALEEQSGVAFYTASGRLSAIRRGELVAYPYLSRSAANSQTYSANSLPNHLPLRFPPNYEIVLEDAPSGHINPRAMICAQLAIAEQQGAEIIRQLVTTVKNEGNQLRVTLANGQTLLAKKVLLATGAFSNCFGLLERHLALKPLSVTTVLAELSSAEAARLRHLPPINYKIEHGPVSHLTILPPLRYPNGRFYISISCSTDADQILPTFTTLHNWFSQPCHAPYLAETQAILHAMLPDTSILSWQVKPCVVSYTPSDKPFIDCLQTDQLYVAIGGNGGSAHPSDAIGQLAATLMIHDRWISELDPAHFKLEFAQDWPAWMESVSTGW